MFASCLLVLLSLLPAQAAPSAAPYRAAILHEPGMPVKGCATPLTAFRRTLTTAGVPLTPLTAAQLADPAQFNADRYDLLIVPTGASFPVTARGALLAFLQRGGDLLCTGGYAFDALMTRDGADWIPYARFLEREMARARDPQAARIPNGGFENGAEGWQADDPARCRIVEARPFAGRRCAEVQNEAVGGGARYSATLAVEPGKTYLIGAQLRTEEVRGSGFAFLAVYQYDRQGKFLTFRDFVQTSGTRDWRRYEARITVDPAAGKVVFYGGLYLATGRMAFDEVTCAPVPLEERINAHFGEPGDGLGLAPTQLTLFSPDQPLRGSSLAAAPGGLLPAGWRSPGAARGYEATAQLRQAARWLPLVEARDAFGRSCGAAGALVRHFAGPFAGSRWALFGVTNRDLFAGAAGQALLRQVVRLLQTGVQAEGLTTDYAIYRPGETATLRLEIADHGRAIAAPRARRILFAEVALAAPDSPPGRALFRQRFSFVLSPGTKRTLTIPWRVPANAPDFVQVTAALAPGRAPADRIETGFCVYSDRVTRSGPLLTYRDNAFTLRFRSPRPKSHDSRLTTRASRLTTRPLLFGTDTWASMFTSRSHSPLTWYRDLQMMRDYGLHMYENLQYSVPPDYTFTEAQWRQFDALIQLSQRFGLPYMAGLLIGQDVAVDDATLGRQAAMCRAFAARYRRVPGLIYYLNGDFRLELKDVPDLRRLWNDFLRLRYGSDDALRQVWGAAAPAEVLGQIPVRDAAPGAWYAVRARDVAEFKAGLMRRWIGALCAAIRAEDTLHPITGEYYQRPINGIDLRLTLDGMDAANFGYFGPPRLDIAQLLAAIKWNDMRRAGKTVNMGEFGVKTHDAWTQERDPWGYHVGRTETEQRQLFAWVVHAALALDVTKIQNWCWADDPDGVFPWGIAWNNPLRPKPVLKLYRNLRLFTDRVAREDRRAGLVMVMPDRWRLGASELNGYNGLMSALECLLATNTPFDVASLEDLPELLEQPPRALLLPLAYALTDAELAALRALAERGCAVYLSGDPSVGPAGQREAARLEQLCAVRFVQERIRPDGLPAPEVEPVGAKSVPNPAGLPLYRCPVGRGALWYSPEPWETLPGTDVFVQAPQAATDARRNLYIRLLPLLGIRPPVQVEASAGTWRAVETPCGSNRLLSLFPRAVPAGVTPVTLRAGKSALRFEAQAGWPCAALLDAAGRPLAASAGRAVRFGSVEIARGTGPWMLTALDGLPLARSAMLAAALTDGGRLWWRSEAKGIAAWVIEWRDGRAVAVAPARVRRVGNAWEVEGPPNDLLLLCPPSALSRYLRALDRL